MELGQGPVFTFPLAEEAQDERAAERAQTHTVHVHVRLTDMPFFFFCRTESREPERSFFFFFPFKNGVDIQCKSESWQVNGWTVSSAGSVSGTRGLITFLRAISQKLKPSYTSPGEGQRDKDFSVCTQATYGKKGERMLQ